MFIHLGSDTVIDVRRVVAILDARRIHPPAGAPGSYVPTVIVGANRPRGAREEPRAIVVTTEGTYLAPIAPETVAKRIRQLSKFSGGETAER
jgi:hypothetical protein